MFRRRPKPVPDSGLQAIRVPGGYEVAAVGESFYRSALLAACGGVEKEDGHDLECDVLLVWEPDNPYDPNAIAVWAGGQKVAHLAREAAVSFQPVAAKLRDRGAVAMCRANITHGWWRDDHDIGDFSVRLDLGDPETILAGLA